MQVKDYLNEILTIIAANPYVKSQSLSFEERPPNAAFVTGTITFIDASRLHFKEFIVIKSESVSVLKYGYNYLGKDDAVVFRYDNALDPHAKKLSAYPEHKHTLNELAPAGKPAFDELLREIADWIEVEE